MYRSLDAEKVTETIETLARRISERFPGSGLWKVCVGLVEISRQTSERIIEVSRPHWGLRLILAVVQLTTLALLAVLANFAISLRASDELSDFLQGFDAAISLAIFVGGAAFFVWTFEARWKRARALQAPQLRTPLVQAELSALKMQLHPHFVFNPLNAIAALIRKRPVAAEQMVVELSEFLRLTLHNAGREHVSLDEEIRFLRRYLKIEETRFGDRLRVAYELDAAALEAEVPNLILQPLVENAIRHGLAPSPGPGHLVVRARRAWDSLVLEVVDNGRGFAGGAAPPEGIGLSNVRGRLRHLYGDAAGLELRSGEGEGLAAVLTLPFRTVGPGVPVSDASSLEQARLLLSSRACRASEIRGEPETAPPFPRTSSL